MARMTYTGTRACCAAAKVKLADVPLECDADSGWSIDRESMGPGWQDSSWMPKKRLQVIEGLPQEAIPPGRQWHWCVAVGASA